MPEATPQDRELLMQFLRAIFDLLDELIEKGRDNRGNSFIDPEFQPLFLDAWREFNPNASFERAIVAVRQTTSESLELAGLVGAQLKLKWEMFRRYFGKFRQFATPKNLGKLLEHINTFLSSFIEATHFGEALRELKDCILSHVTE